MAGRGELPPLNPARVFEVTGRLLSVSRAAEELVVTPAAVSRQVRALERHLGVALFDRVHGGLQLTAAGARYLAELGPLFAALRDATDAVRSGGGRSGQLRIVSPATFAVRWLIPRLAGFHQAHQDIDVQLTTSSQPLDLERGDVDAGITLGDGAWPGVECQRLVPNELVPVLSPERAAASEVAWPQRLASETLLHSLARPDDWSVWLRSASVPGVDAWAGMKYETSLLSYQAAIEGHGVAIAQRALVARELGAGSLVAPLPQVDRGDHTYYVVWSTRRAPSAELRVFRAWLTPEVLGPAGGTR
ncbi:LysR substrate-binding domain-containing protein [Pseudonocardia lutea]|uniref:LysR substrate-binding domain-containing protein n=1 Tax=Pseudonocardia lutea TaxID=2172015 RepID=A0ABW1I2N1_9PSEU